uniref:Pre-mRNA-processing factor 19 n=1 Tax=Pyramimonas obovata TaxID=1411642 RepID=A0A7S0RAF6_9CHLO|mmetsp:Transcript_29638/g.64693  ORF Transcript_29638/g.64693 Transcript_29638/m.64693 type:complete len:498 (+) Transcript_29638:55-1548(+)|eukprot:CAMPEP_0118933818 /NCGR_PEP_ID=MMETSP1169-20130426/12608_1 /TAXON_ID=36882 /ORGANISM="Pyramimonas obovata, Strain CCMP722" /LENGTH=497 /DNA_ID=CAMNT_0006876635 /DNA_START=39 /DNA_END=1532 /DNA_ORIENTATION=+
MFCSLSGQTPEEPVVSRTSGILFEKRLITKHVADEGKCPVTNEPLSADDLLPVKTSTAVKSRPPSATSIPGLLGTFHNEWDALMLEQHALRQQLHTVRQELSHALYQHDAASRVIARLMKERDEARAALASGQTITTKKRPAASEDDDTAKKAKAGITPDVVSAMTALSKDLSKGRKKRQISESLATKESIESYSMLSSQPLHKTTQPGITACDIHPTQAFVATGGVDTSVVLFDKTEGKIVKTLTGHSKRVTGLQFVPKKEDLLVSCSADKTSKLWRSSDGQMASMQCVATFKDHSSEITGISVHPSSTYFVTASTDKSWAFYDMETSLCLTQVNDSSVQEGFTCASFHPDGLILGTGTAESLVRIWDVKSQENVAKFEGHKGPITAMSFSENGYHLATAAIDGVKLWDLRKPKNFKNLTPYPGGVLTTAVKFDLSGLYLGVGGADARVYGVKQDWAVVKTFSDIPKEVTSVLFGKDAEQMFVCSMDRNLRIFGAQ